MVRCFRCLFFEQFNYGTWFEPRGISYLFSVVIQKRLVFRKTVVRITVIMASLDVKKDKGVTEMYSLFTVKQWAAKPCSTVHVVNSSTLYACIHKYEGITIVLQRLGSGVAFVLAEVRTLDSRPSTWNRIKIFNSEEGDVHACTFKITMRLRVKVLFSECFLTNNPPTPCRNQPNSHQLSEAIQRNEVENN